MSVNSLNNFIYSMAHPPLFCEASSFKAAVKGGKALASYFRNLGPPTFKICGVGPLQNSEPLTKRRVYLVWLWLLPSFLRISNTG